MFTEILLAFMAKHEVNNLLWRLTSTLVSCIGNQNFLIVCTLQATAEVFEKTFREEVAFQELCVLSAQEASLKLVGFLEIVNHRHIQHSQFFLFLLQEIPIHGSPQFANGYFGLFIALLVLCSIWSSVVSLQAFLFLQFKLHLSIEMEASFAEQKYGLIFFWLCCGLLVDDVFAQF